VALRYADAITWDPTQADDALWTELKQHFSEPELVELGFLVGVLCGSQRWARGETAMTFTQLKIAPTGTRLHEWIALERGYFQAHGIEPIVR
jgi:hypothetical protein